jgi:TetR/AcrR family transcriptional regulator
MVKEINTEYRILDAAKEVFLSKGFDGARMQEIADTAGINKALLHYYFRSKEKLFEAVFEEVLQHLGPVILEFVNEPIPLEVKVWRFVDNYIEIIKKNPKMPLFILNELRVNPGRVLNYLNIGLLMNVDSLQKQLNQETEKGGFKWVDARHFMVNMISMTLFPFIGKPLIEKILNIEDADWNEFLNERKKIIPQTIMNWIRFDQKV